MTEIQPDAMPVQSPDKAALYARYSYSTRTWMCNAYEGGNRIAEFGMHGSAYALPQIGHVNPALNQARTTALEQLPGWETRGPWTQWPTPASPTELEYRVALVRPARG